MVLWHGGENDWPEAASSLAPNQRQRAGGPHLAPPQQKAMGGIGGTTKERMDKPAIHVFFAVTVSSARLFVAVDLPAPVRQQLMALYGPVRGIAWTRPEQLHLTLRFLGDVEISLRESMEAALARVAVEPFILPVEGLGTFPPRGPARVVWVGVGHGHTRLHQLRQQIDDALLGCGLTLDVRFFQPHVTLGRVKDEAAPGAVAGFLKSHQGFEAAPFRVSSFVLYASEPRPNGAVHTPWREFPLSAPAAPGAAAASTP
jgi:2'-5' RNA ligase